MKRLQSIAKARAAFTELGTEKDVLAKQQAKHAELKRGYHRDQAERHRLRDAEDHDAAMRLVDGDSAFPKDTRRVTRLAKLDEQIAASAAAIRIQEARMREAEAAATKQQAPFVAAILELSSEVQGSAVEAARNTLAELAPHFARLIAADQIRAATIGDSFSVPGGSAPPFSGLAVARAFAKEIPARIKPAELTEKNLLDAAHLISSEIIVNIKQENGQ